MQFARPGGDGSGYLPSFSECANEFFRPTLSFLCRVLVLCRNRGMPAPGFRARKNSPGRIAPRLASEELAGRNSTRTPGAAICATRRRRLGATGAGANSDARSGGAKADARGVARARRTQVIQV